MNEIRIIGRSELAQFPKLGIKLVEAKTDTGAFTSSIHCSHIQAVSNGTQVECIFLDHTHPSYTGEKLVFPIEKETVVKSSNGESEKRYMIRTAINLLGKTYKIYLTLTNRGDMKHPLLIGRRFLRNKFIVDVRLAHQKVTL